MFTQNINPTQETLISLRSDKTVRSEERVHVDVDAAIRGACQRVAPVWPLANFIAVNPLQGFETENFKDAVQVAKKLYHAKGLPELDYFHSQFKNGRITPNDLFEALRSVNLDMSVEDLMKVMIEQASQEDTSNLKESPSDVFLLLSEWSDQLLGTKLYPLMQSEVTKWASAYFDRGEAAWAMPGRENGFFKAWKDLVTLEKGVELAGLKGFREYVRNLPSRNSSAIKVMIEDLGVPESRIVDYLVRHLAATPGWSGLFLLQGTENLFYRGKDKTESLIDYLAVRIAYDAAGAQVTFQEETNSLSPWDEMLRFAKQKLPAGEAKKESQAGLIWLEAFERNYRKRLLGDLGKASDHRELSENKDQKRPKAQAVFCIDVRSEAYRRNLEQQGHYDTYGFAGFFAVPLAHQPFGAEEVSTQCPVLIRPKYLVCEEPVKGQEKQAEKVLNHQESVRALEDAWHEVKNTSVSPFALVETVGGIGGLSMLFQTFAPKMKGRLGRLFNKFFGASVETQPVLRSKSGNTHTLFQLGIPVEDQIAIAENSLRIMGLLKNFGRLVLLCGHGSTTTNNAYATALDCGACGGHRGAPNARVAVRIFNDQKVRNALEARGISIPTDTLFIAGEHNTATDEINVLDEEMISLSHQADLAALKLDLRKASTSLNLERTKRFDNPKSSTSEATAEVVRRSLDWSEARPEWGLAGNAAFIVAKRDLTKKLDLKSRTFLHSYDWQSDTSGSALEVIMTAPMVVAEWINTQYYFSSVDNEVFGSGSKVIHNVVGKLGVMQGNVSDLKIGLPLQSVSNGTELVHEPMRLLVVIEAPKDRVASIIKKHESVKKLVVNEWIRLVVLDPEEQHFYRYSPQHTWEDEYVGRVGHVTPKSQLVH